MYCTVRYLHRFYIYSDSLQCCSFAVGRWTVRSGVPCSRRAFVGGGARDRMTSNKLRFYFDVLLQ